MEDEPLVRAQAVGYSYRSGFQLRSVDVDLTRGFTALVGPNGAGKSTLIRMLAGMTRPATGQILLGGLPVTRGASRDRLRRTVGYLPQQPGWSGRWTAAEYVDFAAQSYGIPRSETEARRTAALEAVNMTNFANRRLGRMSGGEAQRVHMASAIVHDPSVLILDEPTVGLDPKERIRVRSFLKKQAETRAVLVSTHLMDDVALAADRVVVLDGGTVRWTGTVPELEALGSRVRMHGLSRAERGYLSVVEE